MFKHKNLNYTIFSENVVSEALKVVEVKRFAVTYILTNLMTNTIQAWMTKYNSI